MKRNKPYKWPQSATAITCRAGREAWESLHRAYGKFRNLSTSNSSTYTCMNDDIDSRRAFERWPNTVHEKHLLVVPTGCVCVCVISESPLNGGPGQRWSVTTSIPVVGRRGTLHRHRRFIDSVSAVDARQRSRISNDRRMVCLAGSQTRLVRLAWINLICPRILSCRPTLEGTEVHSASLIFQQVNTTSDHLSTRARLVIADVSRSSPSRRFPYATD